MPAYPGTNAVVSLVRANAHGAGTLSFIRWDRPVWLMTFARTTVAAA